MFTREKCGDGKFYVYGGEEYGEEVKTASVMPGKER